MSDDRLRLARPRNRFRPMHSTRHFQLKLTSSSPILPVRIRVSLERLLLLEMIFPLSYLPCHRDFQCLTTDTKLGLLAALLFSGKNVHEPEPAIHEAKHIQITRFLVNPAATIDIKDFLSTNPSPLPFRTTEPSLFSRSVSVPSTHSYSPSGPSSSSTFTTSRSSPPTIRVNSRGQHQRQQYRRLLPKPPPLSTTSQAVSKQNRDVNRTATAPNKRRLPADQCPTGSPPKKEKQVKSV